MGLGISLFFVAISFGLLIDNQVQAQPVGTPVPFFGPLDHTYNLTIADKTYPIRYGFYDDKDIRLENMTADLDTKTITIRIYDENPAHMADSSLTDWQNRMFAVELPRNIINSNATDYTGGGCSNSKGSIMAESVHDTPYKVDVISRADNNSTTPFSGHVNGELCDINRIVSVSYPYGKSDIVIQGTVMVPEFGSLVLFAITGSTVGVIILIGGLIRFRDWTKAQKHEWISLTK